VIEARVAVIVTNPGVIPDTAPAGLMEATAEFDEDQVTLDVRLWVLPSLKVPVALNWTFVPGAKFLLAG